MHEETLKGARQAINNCLGVQQGERVVIITDEETAAVGDALLRAAQERSPDDVKLYLMEDYGERPLEGTTPLALPEEIARALQEADVSVYAATSRKGELRSFRMPMIAIVEGSGRLRHAHMPGINEQLMAMGMSADYRRVKERCAQLHDILMHAERIRVTTPAGTDLVATFSHQRRWVVCDGDITAPGKWTNLPDGEVFTCPLSVDGRIVVDGVLGDHFDREYGVLENNPLIIDAAGGRITRIECDDHSLAEEFEAYTRTDENSDRFGEFAIGCNEGLRSLVGNMLQDEKFPGVHLAVGDAYASQTGADWSSTTHCDMVLQQCTITVDGQKIMESGTFVV